MDGRIFARVLLALVLLAAVAGAGYYVYNIGVVQGRVEGAQITSQEGGDVVNPGGVNPSGLRPYGYYPYGFHPFGFGFSFFGFFLFLILFFFITRLIFWGPRHGWGRHHPGSGWDVSSRMEEWHRKQHEPAGEEK